METPPYEVEEAALSADGRWLAWTINENAFSRLHLRDLVRRRDIALQPRLPAGVYSFSWAARAARLSLHVESPQVRATPGDWTGRRALLRMTESATARLDPSRFVLPEAVSFKSLGRGDNFRPFLFALAPWRHGKTSRSSCAWGPTARAQAHLLRGSVPADGVSAIMPELHGWTGYGKRFTRVDDKRLRPNSLEDMTAALDCSLDRWGRRVARGRDGHLLGGS